ncbi:MAG: hypothetical protein EOO38_00075 [Cytophagaceae bacterium]|nr:MAG: hypothetical protein EOO38_00075 [Cytophagaceae bacterium]
MGSLGSGIVNVVGQGAGLANSTGLLSELQGEPSKVQFLRVGVGTIFEFDSCINESHSRETVPSLFPIEDGGSISDHIFVAPVELSLTGMVSDFPIYKDGQRLLQTLGEAATTLIPPLGITLGAAAQKVFTVSQNMPSRSKEAFRTLTRIQAGNPYTQPPELPQPFIVLTQYARYPDCVIKSLKFDRDASTASTCVFTMTLTQLRRIKPQAVNVAIFKNPGLAAAKQELGEAESDGLAARGQSGKKVGFDTEQKASGYLKSVGSKLNIGQG